MASALEPEQPPAEVAGPAAAGCRRRRIRRAQARTSLQKARASLVGSLSSHRSKEISLLSNDL